MTTNESLVAIYNIKITKIEDGGTFEHIVSFPLGFNTPKIFQGQVTR